MIFQSRLLRCSLHFAKTKLEISKGHGKEALRDSSRVIGVPFLETLFFERFVYGSKCSVYFLEICYFCELGCLRKLLEIR